MRPFSLLGLVAPLLPVVLAGRQFPVVDGVVGGVPQSAPETNSFAKVKSGTVVGGSVSAAITPGKLRYVENSGVCGA